MTDQFELPETFNITHEGGIFSVKTEELNNSGKNMVARCIQLSARKEQLMMDIFEIEQSVNGYRHQLQSMVKPVDDTAVEDAVVVEEEQKAG